MPYCTRLEAFTAVLLKIQIFQVITLSHEVNIILFWILDPDDEDIAVRRNTTNRLLNDTSSCTIRNEYSMT